MPHLKEAFDAYEKNITWLKDRTSPKSFLYVGWRYDGRPWWYDVLCKRLGIESVSVLDIFPPNLADLERKIWEGRYNCKPILGDVREINKIVDNGEYDVIFWDHGPEHVTYEDLKKTTSLLLTSAGKLLLYSCPWGEWRQGPEGGNAHEEHKNYVTREQLMSLGMHCVSFGEPGQMPGKEGELLAFKFTGDCADADVGGWTF